jgi:hypothetical protein
MKAKNPGGSNMKKVSIVLMLSLFAVAAHADSAIPQSVKIAACKKVMSLIPMEPGMVMTLKECMKFDFDVARESSSFWNLEMVGQTVEDSATVCRVSIPKDPTVEIAPPRPFCELQ